jgi:beta-aspartyl-peptidase (threonine type)
VIARDMLTPEVDARLRAGLEKALAAGAAVLQAGGAALDAVEAAVCFLEDDPQFNAGRGAVFTADGTNELDAAIMDGANRHVGAVAGVTTVRNPVSLARAVMAHSDHVLLAGEGAEAFARAHGIEPVARDYFRTQDRWRAFEAFKAQGGFDKAMKYGTVGAVARDTHGDLAAATSTGGITGKRYGRIGDTPIPGAGTWADNRTCAVSATGSGEELLRLGVAHAIAARVRHLGELPLTAAEAVIGTELAEIGGSGGVIVIGASGEAGWTFNSPGMYRARIAEGSVPLVCIYEDAP